MKKLSQIIITFFLVSCNNVTNDNFDELMSRDETEYFKKYEIFNDPNYILTLTIIDTTNAYKNRNPTVILNLLKKNMNIIDTLINDSLFSRNPIGAISEIKAEFIDFNSDGTKDIIVPYGTDPRGNRGLHLYIVENKSKTINYVKGFNEIGNPKTDSSNYLIYSFVLSGPPFCKFYQINDKNEVIDLGHYIEFHDSENSIVDSLINIEIGKIKQEKLRTTKANMQ